MSDPRREFVEAMRELASSLSSAAKDTVRRAVIAFADAYDDIPWNRTPNQARRRRAALLREIGLDG